MTEFLVRVAVPDYIETVEDFEQVVCIHTTIDDDTLGLPFKVLGPTGRIDRKIYRGTKEHSDMLTARQLSNATSFGFQGHRWAYGGFFFDDVGDYDLIYRLAP
jgi:hypothetical protein